MIQPLSKEDRRLSAFRGLNLDGTIFKVLTELFYPETRSLDKAIWQKWLHTNLQSKFGANKSHWIFHFI